MLLLAGLILAVIIGVAVGSICGFALLAAILWCKRYAAPYYYRHNDTISTSFRVVFIITWHDGQALETKCCTIAEQLSQINRHFVVVIDRKLRRSAERRATSRDVLADHRMA